MQKQWKLLLFVAILTLTLACLLGLSVSATTYPVSDETELLDAIDAASNGDIIVMTTSFSTTARINVQKSLTFTGAEGITLSSKSGTYLFDIYDDFNDLDVEITLQGPMTFKGTGGARVFNIGNGNSQQFSGNLVLNITNNAVLLSENQTCIYINQKPLCVDGQTPCTAVINLVSGTVTGNGYYGYAPFSAGITTLNMSGGAITGKNAAIYVDIPPTGGSTRVPGNNYINISGGTVSSASTAIRTAPDVSGKASITISGTAQVVSTTTSGVTAGVTQDGTNVTALAPNSAHGAIVVGSEATVTINGGTVTSTGFTIRFYAPGTLNIGGGTINNVGASGKDVIHIAPYENYYRYVDSNYQPDPATGDGFVKINMTGGTVSGSVRNAMYIMSSTKLTMTGGTITSVSVVWNEYQNAYQDPAYAIADIRGTAQFYSTGTGTGAKAFQLIANESRVTIGGSAQVSTTGTSYCIHGIATRGGALTVTIEDSAIVSGAFANSLIYQESAAYALDVTINGGTLTAATNIVRSAGTTTTVNVYRGTLNAINGVNAGEATNNVYFYGGNFSNVSTPLLMTVNVTGTMVIGKPSSYTGDITPDALTMPGGKLFVLAAVVDNQPTCYDANGLEITPVSVDMLSYYDTMSHAMDGVVAYIGTLDAYGQLFGTLSAAIEAASDGDIVVMHNNEAMTEKIVLTNKEVILTSDRAVTLAGPPGDMAFSVGEDATLTLRGNITYTSLTATSLIRMQGNNGTLNIEAGNIPSGSSGNGIISSAGYTGVTINVSGGTLASFSTFFCIYSPAVLNISGGNITAGGWGAVAVAYAGCGGSVVNITGGTLTGTGTYVLYTAVEPSTINVYGGNITGRVHANAAGSAYNIYGGIFNCTSGNVDHVKANDGIINIYGGVFTLEGDTGTVLTEGSGTLNMVGGYVIRGGEKPLTDVDYADESNLYTDGTIITRNTGAQVRLNVDNPGLRFVSHVDAATKAYVEGIADAGTIEYYTIIFPASHLTALGGIVTPQNIFEKLTTSTPTQYKTVKSIDGLVSDGRGGYYIRTALINISNYTRDFACVAYIAFEVDGNAVYQGTLFDSANDVRNIRAVATEALAQNPSQYNDTQYGILCIFAGVENDRLAILTPVYVPAGKKEYV